jgi:hypothetical protein
MSYRLKFAIYTAKPLRLSFQAAPRQFKERLAPRRASAFWSASRLARLATRPTLTGSLYFYHNTFYNIPFSCAYCMYHGLIGLVHYL